MMAVVASALAASMHAQVSVIEWSADRTLAIQDFKGTAPTIPRNSSAPGGALGFLRIEADLGCRGQQFEGTARAIFVPEHSWWTGAQTQMWERVKDSQSWLTASRRDLEMKTLIADANEELLKHEQLHFDMAEIAARKIRRRFDEAKDVCRGDDDTDDLNRFVGEVTRNFRQEQARYDQETTHGTFLLNQGRWESRVKADLRK